MTGVANYKNIQRLTFQNNLNKFDRSNFLSIRRKGIALIYGTYDGSEIFVALDALAL
jgi:hypothetical protein